ncbi:MAG: mechanosensitive ion channel family protein [Planctomycetia bacterium]|jgi:small-conductance mechanosensitive channel
MTAPIATLQAPDPANAPATVTPLMERVILENTVQDWIVGLSILAGSFLLLGIAKRLVIYRLGHLAARTETDIDDLLVDVVRRTRRMFLFVVSVWIAAHFLRLPGAEYSPEGDLVQESEIQRYLGILANISFWIQAGFWGRGLLDYGLRKLLSSRGIDDPTVKMGSNVLGFIGQVVLWTLVLLLCLEAAGFNVNSLIASLGIGGIAVALALQNVLGDLFASISILLDKPFVVGDAVQTADFFGNVEQIGVKNTRIRSVTGEEIIIGNNDLASSRLRNYKRLTERRCLHTLGLVYSTPHEKLRRVPGLLAEIVAGNPRAKLDRAHFKGFGDSAILFEFAFYTQGQEFTVMMDVQQELLFEVHRRFELEGLTFAFPTQTLHLVDGARSKAPDASRG